MAGKFKRIVGVLEPGTSHIVDVLRPPTCDAAYKGRVGDVLATTGLQEGTAEAAPPLPISLVTQGSWFEQTCARLHVVDPDDILQFSHSAVNVTVRLKDGSEYCMMKASF